MNEKEIDNLIVRLGILLLERKSAEFESLAQEGKSISILKLPHLEWRLHNNPTEIENDAEGRQLFGDWMAVCQYSIFEIIFNMGADTINFLKVIAFGRYDWSQSTAIVTLCRLVEAKKADYEVILAIKQKLPDMRWETWYYTARDLALRANKNPNFLTIANEFDLEEFQTEFKNYLK